MPDHDTAEFRPTPPRASSAPWIAAVVLGCAAVAGAAWWFWLRPAEPLPPAGSPPTASAPAAPAASVPMPEASGPQNLVDGLAPADAALPPLAESDTRVTALLGDLLGRDKVARFLVTEGFVRRVVATVDNLGRAQAPARMWPVQPASQRFTVEGPEGTQTVSPANAARYSAVLDFAEAVPLEAAVALYARLYPLFQQAYEELGYPKRYFNDRLVAVLDHLLLTPEPKGPLRVKLLPVNTEVPDLRPWVRYEFADPALQALSSGQKILVRMGPANEARAKVLIRELRRRVATGEVARKPVP
ncbi:MAG: DUF3014 domain-containing protein [Acidovorax sp.]|nr:MAG: DUF3014 domain-containing protein [Acidovorax sp.]